MSGHQLCPICSSTQTCKILNWKLNYSIFKCNECEVFFSSPLPTDTELYDFYQGFQYNAPNLSNVEEQVIERKKELVHLFELNQQNPKNLSFLDYGGGTGAVFQAAKDLGFDVNFLDIDESSINFVKDNFGLDESHIFRNVNQIGEKKFDCIFCDNVIEHVKFPIELINNLYNMLNSPGILIIKTPYAGNSELFFSLKTVKGYFFRALKHNSFRISLFALLKNRWWTCDPPRHLFAFSEKSLERLIETMCIKTSNYDLSYYHAPVSSRSLNASFLWTIGFKGAIEQVLSSVLIKTRSTFKFLNYISEFMFITPSGLLLKIYK